MGRAWHLSAERLARLHPLGARWATSGEALDHIEPFIASDKAGEILVEGAAAAGLRHEPSPCGDQI